MSDEYELEKRVWTEADFDVMGWHDSKLHAMAFHEAEFEFALDLDYIFKWVTPGEGEIYYQFYVSPVTMVFENVYDLTFDVETSFGLEIGALTRSDPIRPKNAESIGRDTEWSWKLECQEGCIALKAVGYKMFVRAIPVLQRHQSLERSEHGGISFERSFR